MPADAPSPDPGDSPEGADPDNEPGNQDGAGEGADPDGERGEQDDTDPEGDGPDGEIGYATARAELDQILAELSGNDLDVDMLAERVERASTLIEICRGRITNARIQVERVTAAAPDQADRT